MHNINDTDMRANVVPNLNDNNARGYTALGLAVSNNDEVLVKALIKAGADINQPDIFEMTPLDYARLSKNIFLLVFLLKQGAQIQDLPGLLKYLSACDQRSPEISIAWNALLRQQQILLEAKTTDENIIQLNPVEYSELKKYLSKFNKLISRAKRSVNEDIKKQCNNLPTEIIEIVQGYDVPLEGNRVGFFDSAAVLDPSRVTHLVADPDEVVIKFKR